MKTKLSNIIKKAIKGAAIISSESQTKNGGKSYGQFPISSRTDDSMDRKIRTPQRSYKYVIILEVST